MFKRCVDLAFLQLGCCNYETQVIVVFPLMKRSEILYLNIESV